MDLLKSEQLMGKDCSVQYTKRVAKYTERKNAITKCMSTNANKHRIATKRIKPNKDMELSVAQKLSSQWEKQILYFI